MIFALFVAASGLYVPGFDVLDELTPKPARLLSHDKIEKPEPSPGPIETPPPPPSPSSLSPSPSSVPPPPPSPPPPSPRGRPIRQTPPPPSPSPPPPAASSPSTSPGVDCAAVCKVQWYRWTFSMPSWSNNGRCDEGRWCMPGTDAGDCD